MKETIRLRPVLIHDPLPTQGEIRQRFEKLFGRGAKSLMPLIHPCAEEVEKLLCEITEGEEKPKRSITLYARKSKNGLARTTGYTCPICGSLQIRHGFDFCPSCASRIVWGIKTN